MAKQKNDVETMEPTQSENVTIVSELQTELELQIATQTEICEAGGLKIRELLAQTAILSDLEKKLSAEISRQNSEKIVAANLAMQSEIKAKFDAWKNEANFEKAAEIWENDLAKLVFGGKSATTKSAATNGSKKASKSENLAQAIANKNLGLNAKQNREALEAAGMPRSTAWFAVDESENPAKYA